MIQLLSVGKKHENWVAEGIERYQGRLRPPFTIEWTLLPHSSREGQAARAEESKKLLAQLRSDDIVVVLDERGKQLSSPELSDFLSAHLGQPGRFFIVIGGAYGVNAAVHERAQLVWSLSPLVFPHQLVRLIVTEQLYRAQEIAAKRPYHHL